MSDGNGEAFIRITNREIWDQLKELSGMVHGMDDRMNNILEENVDLRRRVRALELRTYTLLAGFTTALLIGAGALAKGVLG